jgi:hypothetical protein
MDKLNCWKVRGCGREQGGVNIKELGVCPAATEGQEKKLNGLNNGKFAGRACWLVAGTLCGGKIQGTSAQKRSSCLTCDFYQQVHDEEKDFKIFPV